MKCIICRHGELHPGSTRTTIGSDDCLVILKHVPTLICDNCGEEYFDEDVTRRLDKIATQASDLGVSLMVREYGQAA